MRTGLYLRSKLTQAGWPPRTRLGRIAFFVLGLDLAFWIVQKAAVLLRLSSGTSLACWVSFLTFLACVLFSWLAFHWLRDKLLWRLRNRLIVTYVFIGVIPVIIGTGQHSAFFRIASSQHCLVIGCRIIFCS